MEIKFTGGKNNFDCKEILNIINLLNREKDKLLNKQISILINREITMDNIEYIGLIEKIHILQSEDFYDILEGSYFQINKVTSISKNIQEKSAFYNGEKNDIKDNVLISFDLIEKIRIEE